MLLLFMLDGLCAFSVRDKLVCKHRACGCVLAIEHMPVKGRQPDSCVERRRSGSAHKQGSVQPSGRHLLADLLHLV